MKNIEAELLDALGAKDFAVIDFCSGYWKAPLHPDSQPLFAFMTPKGVLMKTRTIQGGRNSAANFQESFSQFFEEIRDHFKAWLDDFIIFAAYEHELVRILRRFQEIFRSRNLILSTSKSDFFLKHKEWFGLIVDAERVRLNSKNLSGLRDGNAPRNSSELCEYVHGSSWILNSIPRISECVGPLRELLESAYEIAGGSRKKK